MTLNDRLLAAGQEHVLEHLERLQGDRRAELSRRLEELDFELLSRLRELVTSPQDSSPAPRSFEPPELFPLARDGELRSRAEAAEATGRELLAAAEVGFVLVAGGQASRLGYDAPKGLFPIGPVSGCSLFEIHAQRLAAVRDRYGVPAPWYVMTSPANDAATREFFSERDHFGLPPEDVFFFSQDMLPALDAEGRMLFARPGELFLAPNGHGGTLLGLASSGALDDMRRRGVGVLSYFQVDNPLVRPADPLFLGLHHAAGAGMSSKVVAKRDAGEKVGVLGHIDGELGCIEYSDLPRELREARDEAGDLRFRAGNIAVHAISREFVEQLTRDGLELPWHVARKRMSVVDPEGNPHEVEGFKFETFVFDALGASPASITLEVDRREEFSPVKNASGEDSPQTARRDLCRLHAEWVRAAGGTLPESDAEGIHPVEVDPRYAESQDEFLARGTPEPDVRPTGHLYT